MNGAAEDSRKSDTRFMRVVKRIGVAGWWILWGLAAPLRLLRSIRRSMTGASVTLLLIGIVTVNVVWGYPWTGVFSACLVLFLLGWFVNRFLRPQLSASFSLPVAVSAGTPFSLVTHLRNRGRFPAMELGVQFCGPDKKHRKGGGRDRVAVSGESLAYPHPIGMIRAGERADWKGTLLFDRRGIHPLPDLAVTSMFPFHLFRSLVKMPCDTTIAVTPRLISGDEDTVSRGQMSALGSFSRKLRAGDALDYTGSREYEVGMPVRRWDFTSWARLGKPIVREYQSPSIHMVTLIVDTSGSQRISLDAHDERIERVLSLAATAVTELKRNSVHVRMYITGEPTSGMSRDVRGSVASDCQSLLIRLAAANRTTTDEAKSGLKEVVDHIGNTPALILTSRIDFEVPPGMSRSASVIMVDERDRMTRPAVSTSALAAS